MIYLFTLQLLFRRFYSASSSDDECSMMSDRNVINRRNVREDPHQAYRADKDFLLLEVTARVIYAAYQVLGLSESTSQPKHFPIPADIGNQSNMKKLQFLHKAAAKIVDQLVVNEKMMDSSIQTMISVQERQDLINQQELNQEGFNYNTVLLAEGLFFLNFLDSVSEGDGDRILRQYKYLMLLCRADGSHSSKYALESLYQLLLVNGLSESEAGVFTWNRSVNNRGGAGKNIAFDLEVEHSNNYIKQGINHLGVNVTERAVTRIARAEKSVREIIFKVDSSIQYASPSGKHVEHFPQSDFEAIVKRLVDMNVFEYQEGRHYRHFCNFQRDPLHNLNMSGMYEWINEHKKKLSSGIKAR